MSVSGSFTETDALVAHTARTCRVRVEGRKRISGRGGAFSPVELATAAARGNGVAIGVESHRVGRLSHLSFVATLSTAAKRYVP